MFEDGIDHSEHELYGSSSSREIPLSDLQGEYLNIKGGQISQEDVQLDISSPHTLIQVNRGIDQTLVVDSRTFHDISCLAGKNIEEQGENILENLNLEVLQSPPCLSHDAAMDIESTEWNDSLHDTNISDHECLSFGNIAAERPRLSPSWIKSLQDGTKRYALRDFNRNSFRGSAWQDRDPSGDYDPSTKINRALHIDRNKSVRPTQRENHEHDEPAFKRQQTRTATYEQGRRTGRRKLLRFKFSIAEAFEKFQILAKKFPSPNDTIIKDSYQEGLDDFRDSAYGNSTSPARTQNGGIPEDQVFNDKKTAQVSPSNEQEEIIENVLRDPHVEGSKGCYDISLKCSSAESAISIYSDHSEDEGNDPVRLISTKHGHFSKNCEHNDIFASITSGTHNRVSTTREHSPVCSDPDLDEIKSSIQSNDEIKSRRARVDSCSSDSSLPSIIDLQASNQSECRQAVAFRNEFLKSSARVSKTETRAGSTSNHYSRIIEESRFKSTSDEKTGLASNSRRHSLGPVKIQNVVGGKLLQITTSYCHPLAFNWVPPPPLSPSPHSHFPTSPSLNSLSLSSHSPAPTILGAGLRKSSYPCHFCTSPGLAYALTGLGQLHVEVMQWDSEPYAGYEEVEGGWSERGGESSRMCVKCTMNRMLICACPWHKIRKIEGLDPRSFDFNAATSGVLERLHHPKQNPEPDPRDLPNQRKKPMSVGEKEQQEDIKWCSICIMPAFYECCVLPQFTTSGVETSPDDDIGCGLLLCQLCAFRMMGGQNSPSEQQLHHKDFSEIKAPTSSPIKTTLSLDVHIARASLDTQHYPDGLRADASFLTSTGELMRQFGGPPETFLIDDDIEMLSDPPPVFYNRPTRKPRYAKPKEDNDLNDVFEVNHHGFRVGRETHQSWPIWPQAQGRHDSPVTHIKTDRVQHSIISRPGTHEVIDLT